MAELAVHPVSHALGRFARHTRIVLTSFAIVALIALSFAVGRATMGHTGSTTTLTHHANVAPGGQVIPQPVCHLRGPC
ncbi:MAG: hypothetical protein ACRDVG_13040 [Jatrophihabitantaceae bacterium]